ncbi:MAG: hypothetical protein ACRD96_27640, partial [Bryobacteraceae bacterium]
YMGYYHDASPRLQANGFITWLFSGQTITPEAGALYADPVFGSRQRLIPVGEGLFRLDKDVEVTRVFATDEDERMVLTGPFYAERVPRWRVEMVRVPVLAACFILMSPFLFAIIWIVHGRRARPRGFWGLKAVMLLSPILMAVIAMAIGMAPSQSLGLRNVWTELMWLGTMLLPVAAVLALIATMVAWLGGAGRWLRAYALAVSCAAIVLSAYLFSWNMVAFKPWDF